MEFRWVILLTLWTLLIGPVFDCSQSPPTDAKHRLRGENSGCQVETRTLTVFSPRTAGRASGAPCFFCVAGRSGSHIFNIG